MSKEANVVKSTVKLCVITIAMADANIAIIAVGKQLEEIDFKLAYWGKLNQLYSSLSKAQQLEIPTTQNSVDFVQDKLFIEASTNIAKNVKSASIRNHMIQKIDLCLCLYLRPI